MPRCAPGEYHWAIMLCCPPTSPRLAAHFSSSCWTGLTPSRPVQTRSVSLRSPAGDLSSRTAAFTALQLRFEPAAASPAMSKQALDRAEHRSAPMQPSRRQYGKCLVRSWSDLVSIDGKPHAASMASHQAVVLDKCTAEQRRCHCPANSCRHLQPWSIAAHAILLAMQVDEPGARVCRA